MVKIETLDETALPIYPLVKVEEAPEFDNQESSYECSSIADESEYSSECSEVQSMDAMDDTEMAYRKGSCVPSRQFFILIIITAILSVILFVLILEWTRDEDYNWSPICHNRTTCDGENMQFIRYDENETCRGRSFSCDLKPFIDDWKISDAYSYKLKPINSSEVVVVTYASSNHFEESRRGIISMRSAFPNKIIFYDLGLTNKEVKELSNVCNLEVRKFNFAKYPAFVRQLKQYHFKSIILAELYSEFESFWILDASIRFSTNTSKLLEFYSKISSGKLEPFVLRFPVGHSIFATTHPGMYEYLLINRTSAMETEMRSAVMFSTRSEMSRAAVKWNVLCALTKDCFAPPGAKLHCKFDANKYAKCHRYDQSSLNIIMQSLLERDGWQINNDDDEMSEFASIQRGDTENKKLFIPCREKNIG